DKLLWKPPECGTAPLFGFRGPCSLPAGRHPCSRGNVRRTRGRAPEAALRGIRDTTVSLLFAFPAAAARNDRAGRSRNDRAFESCSSDYFELRHPPLVDGSRRLLLAVYAATLPEAHLDEAVRAADSGGGYCPLREWGVGRAEALERTALEWLKVRCQIMMRGYAVSAEVRAIVMRKKDKKRTKMTKRTKKDKKG
ncbi:MAG: hypothetical protein BJ554DRAFT_7209, partial [Olpidium bornovanus]